MKAIVVCASIAIACLLVMPTSGELQPSQIGKEEQFTSNRMLMRDKLKQMGRILEGLTLNQFDQVEDGAKTLGMISRAASWHIADPTPRYQRLSKNFQELASDLERHAKERNIDAATLDLVGMNVTCAQCHQHMRERTPDNK
jgi:hypothetical protein